MKLTLCRVQRFSWRRNGKVFNIGKDPRVTMRKRSGTLEIGFRSGGRPEDYEGEYQCFATNDFGVALSNKILLRVSSKNPSKHTHSVQLIFPDQEKWLQSFLVIGSYENHWETSFCICQKCHTLYYKLSTWPFICKDGGLVAPYHLNPDSTVCYVFGLIDKILFCV